MGKKLDNAIAILNGTVGDHLARTDNGLATEMAFMKDGAAVSPEKVQATARVAVFVHGLMCTETLWKFPTGTVKSGWDYGSLLERDLGFTPLYVRYNSGRSVPENGLHFSRLLESLVSTSSPPIEELLLIGHSMGGLVIRSACHDAAQKGLTWLGRVSRAIYIGTPHLGAPAERLGRVVTKWLASIDDPYARLIAEIAELRSDGIKDLGDADLRHEDRASRRAVLSLRDASHPVPLLPSIRHYLVAGSLSFDPTLASVFGDAIVPLSSATDGSCTDRATISFPPGHVKVLGGVSHIALAHHERVYEHIRTFLETNS